MSEKMLLLGNEAIARGAYDAGVSVVSSYPGTPSTEITENCATYDMYAEWAPNEKVAAEVAIGASMTGARAMCCMKHVGVNVATDPLFTAAYTGVNAGLVFVAADDPGMHSSQNEQDSRNYAMAAHVPMLEPSDSEEAYQYTRRAYELSEQLDMPVMLRVTTRIAHARSLVQTLERTPVPLRGYEKNIAKYVMMPAFARPRRLDLLERIQKAEEVSETCGLNRMEKGDGKIGVICAGACYQYVKEALPGADILKLGMVYPLPRKMIGQFAQTVETLYVIEELESIFETQVKSWGIECKGADVLPGYGEYSADIIRKAVLGDASNVQAETCLPPRPPALCPGCPHRGAFYVMNKMKLTVFGDIGCYTLGATAPLSALDSTVCMGASISMAHGAQKARGRDFAKKSLAMIGDSTFIHSGLTGLAGAAYNQSDITVLIVDNSTTGMTGQQDHPATGKTLKGEDVPALDLEEACEAMGAQHVRVVDPLDIKGFQKKLQRCLDEDGVSVLIARRPCVMLAGKRGEPIAVDREACIGCYSCLRTGCPALIKGEKKVRVDQQLCTGCGLCADVCPVGCIGGQA